MFDWARTKTVFYLQVPKKCCYKQRINVSFDMFIYNKWEICIYIYHQNGGIRQFKQMFYQNIKLFHVYFPRSFRDQIYNWQSNGFDANAHRYDVTTVFTILRTHHKGVHYSDVVMSAMASQITGGLIVCSTVCSGADQRKHQSSASLAFVRGIHRSSVDSPHKGQVTSFIVTIESFIVIIAIIRNIHNIQC